MDIKEIRNKSRLNQTTFSKTYGIPLRTLQDWEYGKRQCPNYVLSLLERAVNDDCTSFKIYNDPDLMKELGSLYRELLLLLQNDRHKRSKYTSAHDPYSNVSDVFPTKYFTMIYMRAIPKGIPEQLNNRIATFMGFIDEEDWTNSMNHPSPLQTRIYFDIGASMSEAQ